MKKSLKTLLFLFVALFTIGKTNVYASYGGREYGSVQVGDKLVYSSKEDAKLEKVEGVTYDAAANKIVLKNANIVNLVISSVTINIELQGNNAIDEGIFVGCASINFIGDGSLTIKGSKFGSSIFTNDEQITSSINVAPQVKFNMTGTITALKGIGGFRDDSLAKRQGLTNYSSLVLGKNVKIVEGGEIKNEDYYSYIGTKDTTSSNYSKMKVIIKRKKVATPSTTTPKKENNNESTTVTNENKNHTIMNGTTSFTSKEVLDPKYSLTVLDKTSSLDKEKTSLLENEIKDSHLVLLYNISVVNGKGKVVAMKNGEYTIRLKISESDLKAYDKFTAIYVDEEGKVKEKFDTKIDGEFIEFTTTHLSDYGILGTKNVESNESSSNSEEKNNSSKIIIISVVGVALVGAGVAAVLVKKRKAKK